MSSNPRVVHVMPDVSRAFGGPTVALVGYIAALREVGITADVLAPACSAEDAKWLRQSLACSNLHLVPRLAGGSLADAAMLTAWLRQERRRYNVVHVHGLLHPVSSMAARLAPLQDQALAICPFGTMSRYTFRHRRRLLKRLWFAVIDRPNLLAADAIHFCTELERDEARWLGVPLESRNWIAPPPWLADEAAPTSVKRAGARVLFLGRLHPIKGVETLIEAWPAIKLRLPCATLTIAGGGKENYVSTLRALAERSAPDVHFAGFVSGEEKRRQLAAADVFVLPSYQENFGVAVIEAIVAGLPVIISPEVQLAPFVAKNRLGCVTPRDPQALADAVTTVIGDALLRERVRREGRAIVDAYFSLKVVGETLAGMYESVLQQRQRRIVAA